MLFNKQLKAWLTKFKKYKVNYKDGFFHLSNLANSPYTIVETFKSSPFCNYKAEKKRITVKTLFLNAQLYYLKLEEGLWILVSDQEFKKNVVMHNIYDEELPLDYHFINLHYNQKAFTSKLMLINGMVLTDKTWNLFKAGHAKTSYHFKDAHELNITIYFTNQWLVKELTSKSYFKNSNLDSFFKSENTYLFLPDIDLGSDAFYQDFLYLLKQKDSNEKTKEIKHFLNDFFKHFIDKYNLEPINEHYFKLADKDRKYIQQTEKYLMDNLVYSFPGVDAVAEKVGVSPTKLKTDFKVIHNQSLYQYYRYHQMHLANKLLSEKASTVKEVATLLGYENASKFAVVFKEQFGVQPSSLIKEQAV